MSFPRGNLPAINFAEKSATEVQAAIITTYEAIAERSLASGDPVRLFLESIAAIIINQRSIIDFAAKQNLLSYAQGEYLEYIADLVGVKRLKAQPAVTTIRFTLSTVQGSVYTVPSATQIVAGKLVFETTEALEIAIGDTVGDVTAQCTTTGTIGNNLLPGQIKTMVVPLPFVARVENTTTTSGGAKIETDDSMVVRIRLAPASFSVAGPADAYKYWSLTASQSIIDVEVSSPTPGVVDVRPLLENGVIPPQAVLDQVDAVLNADDIRPLTDNVQVLAPVAVNYTLEVQYWLRNQDVAQSTTLQAAIETAVSDYAMWQKTKIGRDINPDELISRMKQAGAKRVNIISPVFAVITNIQVAQESIVTISYQGLEDA